MLCRRHSVKRRLACEQPCEVVEDLVDIPDGYASNLAVERVSQILQHRHKKVPDQAVPQLAGLVSLSKAGYSVGR